MVKSFDPNQLQKIDRPYVQPIYFIHFNLTWQKKYQLRVDIPDIIKSDGTKKIEGQGDPSLFQWADGTVVNGDNFQLLDYLTDEWKEVRTVDYVDDNDTLHLTENYPAYEGYGYKIWKDHSLYFSDRNFTYNSHNYEAYLKNLSNIRNQIINLGGVDNSPITFEFINSKILSFNYLIEFFDAAGIEGVAVEIYKLLIDTEEVFGSDVSTLIWKGIFGQPYDITELSFKIDVQSRFFSKNESLPLDVIDLADFPGADPDDVGKYRNIIYGSLKKVVCPWTDAGWVSTLTANITGSNTSIVVSDATNIPGGAFTTFCDNEEIRVTGNSGNTLTVTRGYNSTAAVSHNKGATIYEKKTDFEAEVAMHPVKSIGDIYIKRGSSEWTRLTSGFTKFLSTGSPARACIEFSDKPKFEQTVDLTSELTDEPHDHTINGMTFTQKECVPDGSSGPTGHTNVIDGNPASYCAIDVDIGVQARFDGEANLGTINKVIIYIHKLDTASTGYVQSPSGSNLQTLPGPAGLYHIIKTSGMAWTDSVVIIGGAVGNQIAEIYKTVEYTPAPTISSQELDPYLTGNSVANMVIGDLVACDVEGYTDPDGNYGGIGTLIERPDWVRKHILIAGLGFVAGDIDASFGTVGTTYAGRISGGYKFAFVLHEVATEAMELFRQLDLQTRSVMFESQGKFKLAFGSTSSPTSQITFTKDNTKGNFIFSKTEYADIRNKMRVHYFRDYSKTGAPGEIYQKINEVSYPASITKYGEKAQTYEFSCIGNLSTMVNDVLAWILHECREVKKVVRLNAFWDATILEGCDYFMVTSNFWSGEKFRTISLLERPEDQIIEIEGIQYVA